jgi:hypothetical protein
MNEYEEQSAVERKLNHITEHIEEMVLDAMLAALKKIKQRNDFFASSGNKTKNELYPF